MDLKKLINQNIAKIWINDQSMMNSQCSILLEVGALRSGNGLGYEIGEYTIVIPFNWRIEKKDKIIIGSLSEIETIIEFMEANENNFITNCQIIPELNEFLIEFNGYRILSIGLYRQPDWFVLDNINQTSRSGSRDVNHLRLNNLLEEINDFEKREFLLKTMHQNISISSLSNSVSQFKKNK